MLSVVHNEFVLLKLDMMNAFNMISRQVAAVLDEYDIYPELYSVLLPWDLPLSMIPT